MLNEQQQAKPENEQGQPLNQLKSNAAAAPGGRRRSGKQRIGQGGRAGGEDGLDGQTGQTGQTPHRAALLAEDCCVFRPSVGSELVNI